MTVIDAQELTKVFQGGFKKRGIVALDNVTLAAQQGEIFGLLGPNGAGKTTFLKIVLGIVKPSSGDIMVTSYRPSDPRSRQRVGYLPENHRFPQHLTGQGLLASAGRMFQMSASNIRARVPSLLEIVGMSKWAGTKIKKYSKGMQQRIGLAQALMPDPEVLLLDEPTDGVDPVGKIEIREVLQRVRDEGKSIILNSHLLSEVESVADRVAILSRGRLVRISSVDALTNRQSQYEVVADFGNRLVEIPEKIGKKISLTTDRLIVELSEDENINYVIDEIRHKKIAIRSVQPMKISLEQSFIETLAAPPIDDASGGQT